MSETTVPSYSSEGISLLARNPAVARTLGRSAGKTGELKSAEQRDEYERGPDTWHGIDDEGHYSPASPEDWRGIDSANATSLVKKSKPKALGDKFRGPVFSVTDILKAPLEKGEAVHTETKAEQAVKQKLWTRPKDRLYLGDSLVSQSLYGKSQHVRDLITNDTELNRAYTGDVSHATENLRGEIAGAAAAQVTAVDATKLTNESELGRLILEDRGGLTDALQSSAARRDLIGADPGAELLQAARERVLNAVEPQLKNSGDIITEDVLRKYPLVALDLLTRPGLIRWVEENRDNARSLVQDAGRITEQVQSELPDRAEAIVGQNILPFTSDWFASNQGAAEVVVSDQAVGYSSPYGEYLISQKDELASTATQRTEATRYWRERGAAATNNALPDHLLEGSPSLSLLASKDTTVSSGLMADSANITAGYPDAAETSDLLTALQAYSIGLGERIYGVYERVA